MCMYNYTSHLNVYIQLYLPPRCVYTIIPPTLMCIYNYTSHLDVKYNGSLLDQISKYNKNDHKLHSIILHCIIVTKLWMYVVK